MATKKAEAPAPKTFDIVIGDGPLAHNTGICVIGEESRDAVVTAINQAKVFQSIGKASGRAVDRGAVAAAPAE